MKNSKLTINITLEHLYSVGDKVFYIGDNLTEIIIPLTIKCISISSDLEEVASEKISKGILEMHRRFKYPMYFCYEKNRWLKERELFATYEEAEKHFNN
jgi:hypothetical protein